MARGRFEADVDLQSMKRLGAKRKLVLSVSADDAEDTKNMIRTYEQDAVKRVEAGEQPRRVVFIWDILQGKRKLVLNNLQWALITLTVRLLNEGMPDGLPKKTPIDLYNEDMGDVAPCRGIEMEAADVEWLLAELGLTLKYSVPVERTTKVIAYVIKTSSHWNDAEAHVYINFLFNRLAMMGVPQPDDQVKLREQWFEWMQAVDESRADLHGEELSPDQYRTLHALCEGCMDFIGRGGGHLAHIKSVGAGGEEPQLARGSEWLHLCAKCHLGIVHAKGWGEFKKLHPHLAHKIDAALEQPATGARLYPPVEKAADDVNEVVVKGGILLEPQPELFEKGTGKPPWGDWDPDDPRHPIV